MTKVNIEDQELAQRVREYLEANGTAVAEDTPIAVTLPGAGGKQPQKDESGSGLMTAGGKFAPGYDAKLKSALYAIIRGEPNKIPTELVEHGPMYRPVDEWTPELAREALDTYGWPQPTLKAPKPKKDKASEDGEVEGGTNSDGEPLKQRRSPTKADRRKLAQQSEESAEATV